MSRQLTSFCPPPLSDGGWPLDNTPEQQQRLSARVYKLLKEVHVARLHLEAICSLLIRWCCCALMSIRFYVFSKNVFTIFPFFSSKSFQAYRWRKACLTKSQTHCSPLKRLQWRLLVMRLPLWLCAVPMNVRRVSAVLLQPPARYLTAWPQKG